MPTHTTACHTVASIAQTVAGELLGPPEIKITGVERLDAAQPGQISFIGDQKYAAHWIASQASAVLVTRGVDVPAIAGRAVIFVQNADLAMAQVLELFAPEPVLPLMGVHASAVVDPSASVGEGARIGPCCVIGPDAQVGERAVLHANVTVMAYSVIGADSVLWPGVVIRERCTLGERCILHSNVNIGADGFGYRPAQGPDGPYLKKIPQIGTVMIEDDVEIGAGSCVDRGKFSQTVIGRGTKIDNLVQIGHNCQVGRRVVLAGCVAVAGSAVIGDDVMIGGMAGVRDHVTVGAGARITGGAQVISDVPAGEAWGGIPGRPVRQAMREVMALKKLPDLIKAWKKGTSD